MKRLLVFSLALFTLAAAPRLSRAQDQPPPPPDNGSGAPDGGPGAPGGPGDDSGGGGDVSFQQFYDNLSQDGQWVQTPDYGYAFQPNVQDPNWAPYTDGSWAYSDAGWVWVSDEPWGWATYHYGRWAFLDDTGWVWVPGYQWAPAWVSWRYGGGYAGWAPLPPDQGGFGIGIDFHFGDDVDGRYHIGGDRYNFVPVGRLGSRDLRGAILPRGGNVTIINRTTNITNLNYHGNHSGFSGVQAGGPPINEVNAHASHPVPMVHLAQASGPGRSAIRGNTLSIYAPRVNAASMRSARPANVGRTVGRTGGESNGVNRRTASPAYSGERTETTSRREGTYPPERTAVTPERTYPPAETREGTNPEVTHRTQHEDSHMDNHAADQRTTTAGDHRTNAQTPHATEKKTAPAASNAKKDTTQGQNH